MMRGSLLLIALCGASTLHAAPAELVSMLALPGFERETLPLGSAPADDAIRPELWLAQRAIEREWGPSEDSVYVVVDIPGWKSEGGALLASALVPGAGQFYVGEGSGWAFLLAEIGGWAGRHFSEKKADRYTLQAAQRLGDPYDSTSAFSFARYEQATGGDAAALETLYQGDRSAFYQALASDGTWFSGFRTDAFDDFASLHSLADDTKRQTRWIETALWMNHLWSAVDAIRAARFHNLPLRTRAPLRFGVRPDRGGTGLVAALTRKF